MISQRLNSSSANSTLGQGVAYSRYSTATRPMIVFRRLGEVMAELCRYAAFISYSSKNAAFAKRPHRALECCGIPKCAATLHHPPSGLR